MPIKRILWSVSILAFAFLAGSITTLGFAPFSIWFAPLIALCILCFSLSIGQSSLLTRYPALKKSTINLKLTFAFSFGLLLSGCHWVYVSMVEFGGTPIWLGILMTCLFCGFIASLLLPFIFLEQRITVPSVILRSLVFAALWTLCEWLRSWFLTGFPWLYIGYAHIDGPLANYAPYISVYGISFISAFSSMSLVQIALPQTKHHLIEKFALAVILLILWGLPNLLSPQAFTENKSSDPISVALIQPNLDIYDKWNPVFLDSIKHYLKTATAMANAELTVWPETAVPELYHNAFDEFYQYSRKLKQSKQAVILGIPSLWHSDTGSYFFNTMIGSGEATGIYHKQKLVPFGEFIPLEDQLRGIIQFFDLPMSEFRPGPAKQSLFKVFNKYLTQPYICYEIVYPEFVAQSAGQQDFLLTVSNDAWFGHSIGPAQHLEIARMRALENGRYLMRATNTGMTAIIGPDGKIISQLPSFEQGVLTGEIYARKGYTPVAQYGTLAPILFSCFMVLLCSFWSARKSHQLTLS